MSDRLYLEHRDRPLTVNEIKSGSHHQKSKEIAKWREVFGWLAKGKPALQPPVGIKVHRLKAVSRRIDLGHCYFASKGAIDGLVDAGVLPDDNELVVVQLEFLASRKVGYEAMGLEVTEL